MTLKIELAEHFRNEIENLVLEWSIDWSEWSVAPYDWMMVSDPTDSGVDGLVRGRVRIQMVDYEPPICVDVRFRLSTREEVEIAGGKVLRFPTQAETATSFSGKVDETPPDTEIDADADSSRLDVYHTKARKALTLSLTALRLSHRVRNRVSGPWTSEGLSEPLVSEEEGEGFVREAGMDMDVIYEGLVVVCRNLEAVLKEVE